MTAPSPRETVNIFWPMTIPAHASFLIASPYTLKISYPQDVNFRLTIETPIHLLSASPVHVMPSGVLSPGFARGWMSLPTELKLAILRQYLVYPAALWPRNANKAIHDTLFHYLRMTPEIALLSRELFFAENTFVLMPLLGEVEIFSGLPPVAIRPIIRRLRLFTWLEPGDNEIIKAMAEKKLGFEGLARVKIQCLVVKLVRSFLREHDSSGGLSIEECIAQLTPQLPPLVGFEAVGTIEFDRLDIERGGMEGKLLEVVGHVENIVKERFQFGVQPHNQARQ